jgi:hypothetical protein
MKEKGVNLNTKNQQPKVNNSTTITPELTEIKSKYYCNCIGCDCSVINCNCIVKTTDEDNRSEPELNEGNF